MRLVRRKLNGKFRFYAQLVNEGEPHKRFEIGSGVIGLDIGPSTIAIVSAERQVAMLKRFCDEIEEDHSRIRLLQRRIDRQRRAANPGNYEPDWWVYPAGQKPRLKNGKARKGYKRWVKSKRQLQNEKRLAELKRRQAEHRKSLHGHLVNTIFQMGDVVRLEKLSYKALQRRFGKSVGVRAPGMFVDLLRQKPGVSIEEFLTYNTKLSQRCHGCGQTIKKPLSQRWHKCECGITAQRDLYSAFLATCVEDGEFNVLIANERWAGLGSALRLALDDLQTGDRRATPSSFGIRRQSQSTRIVS